MSCICQGCGRQYTMDLIVPDYVWEKIKPEGKAKGAGLLCGCCIIQRLESILSYSTFHLATRPLSDAEKLENLRRALWPKEADNG